MMAGDCPKVYVDDHYEALFGPEAQALQPPAPPPTGLGLADASYPRQNTALFASSVATELPGLPDSSPLPSNIKDRVAAAEQAAVEAEATLAEAEASLAKQTADLELLHTEAEREHARMELKYAQDIIAAHRALAFAKRRASSAIAIEAVNALVP